MSDLNDSVFRALQTTLLARSPEFGQEAIQALEAIRILHENAAAQDERIRKLEALARENGELLQQLVEALSRDRAPGE